MGKIRAFQIVTLLALLVSGCFGQGSLTIYNNGTSAPILNAVSTTTPSAAVFNIGQANHIFQVRFTNAPSHTCTTGFTPLVLQPEASYDGTNWFSFGVPITPVVSANLSWDTDSNGAIVFTRYAYGAFPFVRMNPKAWDTTNCLLTVNYTGTLQPGPLPSSLTAYTQAFQTAALSPISSTGKGTIVAPNSGGARISLYGYRVQNITGTTSFAIECDSGGGTTHNTIVFFNSVAAGTNLVETPTGTALGVCPLGDNLVFNVFAGCTLCNVQTVIRVE